MSQQRPQRSSVSLGDMLRSVLVVLVPVVAFVGYQTWAREEPNPAPPVDYVTAAEAARDAAPFELLAPAALPAGWRATSVRYRSGAQAHWHLGVLTADDEYVGLEQILDDVDDAVQTFAPGTSPVGSATIDGRRWEVRTDPERGETTLVRQDGEVSTVVTGTVSEPVLVDYIGSLEP